MRFAVVAVLFVAAAGSAARAQVVSLDQVTASPGPGGIAPAAPVWSPDGATLAFLWGEGTDPSPAIYTVHKDGSRRARLGAAGVSEVRWLSPRELVAVRDGQLGLSTDGTTVIVDERRGFEHLAVAPDGASLAAVLDGDVYLFPLAGGPARRLTSIAVAPLSPRGRGTYWRRDVEVGKATWANDVTPLSFSPDGRWLALHVVDRRRVAPVGFPSYGGDQPELVLLRRGRPGGENESRQVWALPTVGGDPWRVPLQRTSAMQVVSPSWSRWNQLGKRYDLAIGPSATHAWTRGPDGPDLVRRLVERLDAVL